MRVTTEAEAGMTSHCQCWGQFSCFARYSAPQIFGIPIAVNLQNDHWCRGQFSLAHCTKPLVCACVFIDDVTAVSNSTCKSVGRASGCIFIVHSLAVSFFWHRLVCPTPNSTEWLIACLLTWQGCDRFWCYRDQCGAYGLLLSVIWPPVFITLHLYSPVFITVSGALIPECNGLSQFIEDTDKPYVAIQRFNVIACMLVQSSWKTLFQTLVWPLNSDQWEPVSPAGAVAYY